MSLLTILYDICSVFPRDLERVIRYLHRRQPRGGAA